jgi:3-oxoacyl-[acyl-carrier-protein] synthase-3
MGIGFLGIGVAFPARLRENDFWDGKLAPRTEAQRRGDVLAVERSASGDRHGLSPHIRDAMAALGKDDLFRGAVRRYVLDDDEEVSTLEARAVSAALADAAIEPARVDVLLAHSLLPDVLIPNNAPAILAKCGMTGAAGWSLDVGCASFQAQAAVAEALVRAGTFACPVIVQSASWTRFVDFDEPHSVGFGDAATAAVMGDVGDGYGILGHYAKTDGALRDGIVFAPVREGAPQRRWWDGSCAGSVRMTSFDVALGKSAGQRATEFCEEACHGALRAAGLTMSDVALFVCNQSTGWFVDACRRALGLPGGRYVESFADVANINECALLHNLQRARAAGRLRDGDVVLFYSPAAGFTRTAIVYRWREAGP